MEISELYKIFVNHPVVTTDSRDCPAGSIFFALKGASFNGNKFAAAALDKGCSYAVVDEADYATDPRCLLVDNCLATLQQLAHHHRRQLGTRIIGITGTNGKTTTKELTAAVLKERFNVLYTQGNFNNDIGVPKTLLRLRPEHEIAVVEMGASHPGDIKTLVDIVEPDYAIITNVGRAHLQGFGSFEGVVRTKGELYDFMRTLMAGGIVEPQRTAPIEPHCVFIDNDNEHLRGIAHHLPLVSYGTKTSDTLSVEGSVVSQDPMLTFRWRKQQQGVVGSWHEVRSHLIGAYNIANMLAAATIGTYFGVSESQIVDALEGYEPSNNRSQLEVTAHNRLIVDAYNANPTSMAIAISNFGEMHADNKMAILGSMKELGSVSHTEHEKIIEQLRHSDIHTVWLVGEEFKACEVPAGFRLFDNVEQVKTAIDEQQPQGYYILIKGSNSTKLFQLPEKL